MPPEDGREVHAQELCAGGGDEARDGGRRRLREARLHRLQRVRYEAPLEDREHGSPEPHEAGLRDRRALARRVPKELPRLAVVEEDAPLEVADEHRLRRLGDDGGKPVPLLVHLLLRVRYPRLDLAPESLVLVGERIDRAGELPHLRSAHLLEPV